MHSFRPLTGAEHRLCAFGCKPHVEGKFDSDINRPIQGAEQVLEARQPFMKYPFSVMKAKWETTLWDDAKQVLRRIPYVGGVFKNENDRLYVQACRQLNDEDAWALQMENGLLVDVMAAPPRRVQSNMIVKTVWEGMNKDERADLILHYFQERFPDFRPPIAELMEPLRKLKERGAAALNPAAQQHAVESAQQLLFLLSVQKNGPEGMIETQKAVFDELEAHLDGHEFAYDLLKIDPDPRIRALAAYERKLPEMDQAVRKSFEKRYIDPVAERRLTVSAQRDFLEALDEDAARARPVAQVRLATLKDKHPPVFSDDDAKDFAEALPPSLIRGAFLYGILKGKDLQTLVEFYDQRSAKLTAARQPITAFVSQELLNLQKGIIPLSEEERTKMAEAERAKNPWIISDMLKEEFGKLSASQKLAVGAIGVGVLYFGITRMMRKWNEGGLVGFGILAASAYALGGDKMVRGAIGRFSDKKDARDLAEKTMPGVDSEQFQRYEHLMQHTQQYLVEHGEDADISELAATCVIADLPMNMLAHRFKPTPDGRSGDLNVENGDQELIGAIEKNLGGAMKPGLRKMIQGNHWGNPLAHLFYLYALHGAPDTVRNNLEEDISIMNHLNPLASQRRSYASKGPVGYCAPLEDAENFDQITDKNARAAYMRILIAGREAAKGEKLTLGDFIISLTADVQWMPAGVAGDAGPEGAKGEEGEKPAEKDVPEPPPAEPKKDVPDPAKDKKDVPDPPIFGAVDVAPQI
ncbi:MAG: hypothetical protein V1926_02230 [Candidatus Peregrinibacteria bacterium]